MLGRLAAVLAGVPIRIFTVHGWAFSAHSGIAAALYEGAERVLRPLTTITICVAESERVAGISARVCDPERTIVIRHGVAADAEHPTRSDGAEPRVVSVGRLQRPKDPLTLVRALGRIRTGFSAVVVGDGPGRPALEAEIHRLGLERAVVLLGDRDDVPASWRAPTCSCCQALPRGADLDPRGDGGRAAGGGVPSVGSPIVVDGETGLLVPAPRPRRLADALPRLLDDRGSAPLGEAGRARARDRFDLGRSARSSRPLRLALSAGCSLR